MAGYRPVPDPRARTWFTASDTRGRTSPGAKRGAVSCAVSLEPRVSPSPGAASVVSLDRQVTKLLVRSISHLRIILPVEVIGSV